MKRIFKYLAPYWWQMILIVGFTYISVWASLQLPELMSSVINKGILSNDQSYIISGGLHMLIITIVGVIAAMITSFLASLIATGFSCALRLATFRQIESFSLTEINYFSTASLITRSTNDVQQIQQVTLLILRVALQAPLMAVGAIFSAIHTAPSMTWVMALSIVALLLLVVTILAVVLPKFKVQQKLIDKLNLVARENLTGLRVIRAFNNESIEERKFNKVNRDVARLNLIINRLVNIMQPSMILVINFTMLAIIWVGSNLVVTGNMEIGNMMAFMQYSMQVIISFLLLVMVMVQLPRSQVSAGRIKELLATTSSIKDPVKPESVDTTKPGLVEFKNVTFTYPGAEVPVLDNINFTALPGQTTAIIGSTGSGKSTLINLIPRLYDVSSGQVIIKDRDVRKINRKTLVNLLGVVPQKGLLFSGTVESNIKYADANITDATAQKAAKTAQAKFIKELDGGYQAHIAQGGSNVSGGQRQRLSIARALAKDPEILIFDDSFSALDYSTDAALRKELARQQKDKTIIIVTQRIATIRRADQIIVLESGSIVGKGTHKELLRSCKVYREIAASQFSDEEMAKELKEAKNGKQA